MLTLHGWIAVTVTIGVFVVLQVRRRTPVDLLFLVALVAVTLTGVISPRQALAGFSSTAVLTIGALLVVAAGLRITGVLDWVGHRLLGQLYSERPALWVLAACIASVSAFLLNTALVAMAMPVVLDWCRKRRISPSRLLIPVSYFAILGGVCTLIGTSTTLVVNDKLIQEHHVRSAEHRALVAELEGSIDAPDAGRKQQQADRAGRFLRQVAPMGLFEIGKVGLPCAIVGTLVLVLFGRRLLPDRTDMIEQLGEQRREYLVEMLVQPECRLIGESVERAGLRHLPGLFLIEIARGEQIITPVTPSDVIQAGDRLVFTGIVSTIIDLERIPGLVPAADRSSESGFTKRPHRHLTEVVLSRTSPLINTTVREANFRAQYNAAVVAVHRNGVRLTNKIGNIELEPGDTLLLQTPEQFVSKYRNSRDFYLVSSVQGDEPRRHDRALLAAVLAFLLVFWLAAASLVNGMMDPTDIGEVGWSRVWASVTNPPVVALAVAVLMIITRCMRVSDARAAIDYQILFIIAGALGLGKALEVSGAAETMAAGLINLVGSEHPFLLLLVLYLTTMVLTEMITNNAVAAMLFPLAVAIAWNGGFSPRPFIMAVTLAASMTFITPMGYQSNLMVMGPGGYRPRDYLRVGLPIAIVVTITALVLIPLVYGPL